MSHHQLNTVDDVCVCFPNRQMLNIKDSIQSEKRDEKYQKKQSAGCIRFGIFNFFLNFQ